MYNCVDDLSGLVFTFGLVFLHGGYEKMGIIGQILQLFIILLSGPCYYIYFWLKNKGQTTGMQAWKIQLVSHDDKPIKNLSSGGD